MRNNFTMHLKNIYAEGELPVEATCKELLQVQTEGSRQVERKKSCGKLNYYKKKLRNPASSADENGGKQ